ncbi:MAG: hypothetical protein N3F10_06680 [Candidatus Bathyarchaeota archaeon]|nr:hypothetical protein [Candidatus Bathyarchaeota archaeon]
MAKMGYELSGSRGWVGFHSHLVWLGVGQDELAETKNCWNGRVRMSG